ncbi:unnamed protein product [Rhizoctonia solani]|uniref:Uncharacterized protein n=1 Tax=Rhizoctonia solani TaxID=456999 RepID=A0A8H3GIS9_9AGAM|nr:unnamed protein product [Rhizoctonia solani]
MPVSLIDAQTLHTNSSVSLFSYTFRRANVARNNEDPTKQMRPVPYMANTLDECEIRNIVWTLELPVKRMQFKSNIFCKLGGHKDFTFKVPDNITLAMTYHRVQNSDMGQDDMLDYLAYNSFMGQDNEGLALIGSSPRLNGLPTDSSSANNVLAVLDGLQRDLYLVISSELALRQMKNEFFHSTYVVEWTAGMGRHCFESGNWSLNHSRYNGECAGLRDPGRVLRAYGTTEERGAGYDLYPDFLAPFGVTSTNLLIALRDAIRIDLGDLDTSSNIYLNKTYFNEMMEVDPYPETVAPLLINASPPWRVSHDYFWMWCTPWTCVNGTWVGMLKNMAQDTPYENIVLPYRPASRTASVFNLSYLCPKVKRKPVASLLMSVFVATATMYNFLFAIFNFIMSKVENWYQTRPSRQKALKDPEWHSDTLLLSDKCKYEPDDAYSLENENGRFTAGWQMEQGFALRSSVRATRTAALPSQERKLDEILFEAVDITPDAGTRAPLMRRSTEESEVADSRYPTQAQAASVFEASHLTARALREQEAREGRLGHLDALMIPELPTGPCRQKPLFLLRSLLKITLNIPMITITAFTIPMNILKGVIRSIGLTTTACRLPLSVAITNTTGTIIITVGKEEKVLVRIVSSKLEVYRKANVQAGRGAEPSDGAGQLSEQFEDGLGKRGISEVGGQDTDRIAGIVDLMRSSLDGEKLGGLSVSPLPPNDTTSTTVPNIFALLIDSTPNLIDQATFFMHTFEDQSILDHEVPLAGASRDILVALEIPDAPSDSKPKQLCATFNPLAIDIQTFGLAPCMDQDSAINNRRMSQAFRYSPSSRILAPYYGVEGARESVLAAVNERIQAMESDEDEYSSDKLGWNGTGIYDLDRNAPTLSSNWTNVATSNYGLDSLSASGGGNSTYGFSRLEAFSATYPTSEAPNTTTMAETASAPTLVLSINATSAYNHSLVIGGPSEATSTKGNGTSTGIVMVFRSIRESKSWRRTKQDVDTAAEREKALARYQEIGLASMDAIELDHWNGIDKVKAGNATWPDSKADGFETSGKTTGQLLSGDANLDEPGAPAKYWSDSGVPKASKNGLVGNVSPDEASVLTDSNEADDPRPPKPVLNVAYFGDSGRSAPVPPEEQADFAHPILLADPLPKHHTSKNLASTRLESLHKSKDDSPTALWPSSRNRPTNRNSALGAMVAVPKDQLGPLSIPIDARD